MAFIFPFAACKPRPEVATDFSCPPYDVISVEDARRFIADKPNSLLPALLPELIEVPDGENLATHSASYLHKILKDESLMCCDKEPGFYVYQQTHLGSARSGFFCCVSTHDYESGNIKRHELTRPDKVQERMQYMISQMAHAEPVMLAYKNNPRISALMKASLIDALPLLDFTDEQGGRHRLFQLDSEAVPDIQTAFEEMELYIADGHHRCQAAVDCAHHLRGLDEARSEEYTHFPAVLLPDDELVILPYHRYLRNLSDLRWDDLTAVLGLIPCDPSLPLQKGSVVIGSAKGWFEGTLPAATSDMDPVLAIDVHVLHETVLKPLYQIHDIRTDHRIGFTGGNDSLEKLTKLLEKGTIDLAFLMVPVSINTILEVSDSGQIMPPKSTWFEPKLRSGLLIHTF